MTDPLMSGIKACVFDAYGTLFDVHSAVGRLRDEIGPKADELSRLWRSKQLEYTWLRALMGKHENFWQVTGDALDYALASTGVGTPPIRQKLMEAYLTLDAYDEVPAMLTRLKAAGMKLAILSNGEPDMLDAAVKGAGIDDVLDHVLSVETVGIYKPHPSVYQLAIDRLDVSAAAVSFQSSNAWDVNGASSFGLRPVWINRFGAPAERLPGGAEHEMADLNGLADLIGA
ncbi:MAG: haloacid dehalogenase type II [Geminicoccales bacterium]